MKKQTIGILAGMGPYSTSSFINLVLSECQKQYGAKYDIDYPKMIISSLPVPFYPDRPINHKEMEKFLHEGLEDFERLNVNFTAIACNTAHVYYPQLKKRMSSPLLNMVELSLNTLSITSKKVAVIAARPTIDSEIYQTGIKVRGYEFVDIDWQSQINTLIELTRTSQNPLVFEDRWKELVEMAKKANVDTIVIACLDLSSISKYIKSTTIRVLDTSLCLAQEIVKQWLAQSEHKNTSDVVNVHWKNFLLSTDQKKLQLDKIHHFLSTQSYWCLNIPYKDVVASINNSLCFAIYDETKVDSPQIGFARVVTDKTTFAWICDVYVEPAYRGNGLAKWMIDNLMEHSAIKGLRRICLTTKDAHNLYLQSGFEVTKTPDRWMEVKAINPYGNNLKASL